MQQRTDRLELPGGLRERLAQGPIVLSAAPKLADGAAGQAERALTDFGRLDQRDLNGRAQASALQGAVIIAAHFSRPAGSPIEQLGRIEKHETLRTVLEPMVDLRVASGRGSKFGAQACVQLGERHRPGRLRAQNLCGTQQSIEIHAHDVARAFGAAQ
ncbi:MAG TPA: hypothetical protein VF021_11150 [Longimicrobiales bacterium]